MSVEEIAVFHHQPSTSDEEMPRLKALYERGMQNGVKDLRMVGPYGGTGGAARD